MNMQALQSLLAQQAAAPPKAALEFKAGLMTMTGTTVTADPRRGKVSIIPGDDGLVHFQWTQRPGGNLEPVNDLVLFPGDSWERVPECKTGRVYLLRAGGSKRFFWLQEEKDDKDKEIETNINKFINDPSSLSAGAGGDGPGLNANDAEQEQLMQLLSSHGLLRSAPAGGPPAAGRPRQAAAPSTPAAAAPATPVAPAAPARPPAASSTAAAGSSVPAAGSAASNQQIDALRTLAQLMQNMGQRQQQPPLNLGSVADADRVIPLLNDDAKALEALYPHLPEGQRNPQALRDTLRSPQLQQTLSRMTHALNSPQFGTVMASLGLPVGGADFGVNAFVRAVQERADQERKQQQGAASSSSQAPSSSAASSSSSAPSGSAPASGSSSSASSFASGSSAGQSKPDPKDPAKK